MTLKMPKFEVPKLQVNQEAIARENEIKRKLFEKNEDGEFEGGIYFSKEKDNNYLYLTNPYLEDNENIERVSVIKLKTEASAEDVERIRNEIIPTEEAHEMLIAMAETYKLKQMLLLEGPTAVGKTYLVEKFTELLRGSGIKPLDFYCSGQTDVSELMAKWVPKIKSEEEKKKWHEFIESTEAQESLMEMEADLAEESLSEEKKLTKIHKNLRELVKDAGLDDTVQWDFQYGSIPKAMTYEMTKDGNVRFDGNNPQSGVVLHIEEVGLAEPQVINALLQLRGKRGKVADGLQLWQNGGRKIKAGANFWTVLTTNPPEAQHGYLARNAIDPALARGVVFKRIADIKQESLEMAAKRFFTYTIGENNFDSENMKEQADFEQLFPLEKFPAIGKKMAELMASFHHQFDIAVKKGADKGREQKIPLTMDDFARVADYINLIQLRDPETGYFDLISTTKKALRLYYIDRLADENFKEKQEELIENIWTENVHKEKLDDGTVLSAKDYIESLIADAYEEEMVAEFEPMILLEFKTHAKGVFEVVSEVIDNFKNLANIGDSDKRLISLRSTIVELMNEVDSCLENFDIDMDSSEEEREAQMKESFSNMSGTERKDVVTRTQKIQARITQVVDDLNNLES